MKRNDQTLPPSLIETSDRVVRLPIQDRALAAAKRGLIDPRTLTDDEMKLVCRTLIFQYAQMGIG